jgi:hypothetical protein
MPRSLVPFAMRASSSQARCRLDNRRARGMVYRTIDRRHWPPLARIIKRCQVSTARSRLDLSLFRASSAPLIADRMRLGAC